MKLRLEQLLVKRGLAPTRSQAEQYIRLGHVRVGKRLATEVGTLVDDHASIRLNVTEQYVSRGGMKLASVAQALGIIFKDKTVLDVGSSTGGFTDYALQHGAKKVFAVDSGTDQLHRSLRADPRIELHEKTDIRDFIPGDLPDVVVADISFISLRDILPAVARLSGPYTDIVVMVKPQFEAEAAQKSHGIIKNDRERRQILKDFEAWVKQWFIILAKADSDVPGAKGNRERFYLLRKL